MKNPGFLVNGTIVVLKPTENNKHNIIAVTVGRYSTVVEGFPEYIGLPIILDSCDEKDTIAYLTQNNTMSSYITFFEDEVVSQIGIIRSIEEKEWVIINTINYIREKNNQNIFKNINKIKKLEITLEDALEEKNFVKFKWIISNINLDKYYLEKWILKITNKKEFFIEYFNIKEKDIDYCLHRLQRSLNDINMSF